MPIHSKRYLWLVICCLPFSLFGQYTFFQNTQQIIIPDVGIATPYPSLITVSGQPAFLTNLSVNFQSVFHGNGLGDVDVLLEAPNGQKIMLFSDVLDGEGIFVLLNNLSFASNIYRPFNSAEVQNGQNTFEPTNFAPNPDTFPTGGPGIIDQAKPSFHALDGINPNGVWKLWVVSDDANGFDGSLGYDNVFGKFGWELAIEASNTKPCSRPDIPTLDLIEDTYVQASWASYDNQTGWDLYYALDSAMPPQANTAPTMDNVATNNHLQINNLEPNRAYQLWVRGDCGNNQTSEWIGPLHFRTKIYPCLQPIVTAICDTVKLSTLPSFSYWKPASCAQFVPDETPKRMLQFTAPFTGKYDIQYSGVEAGHISYKATTSMCDTSGWTCLYNSEPGYYLPVELVAGMTYWFFVDGGDYLKFDICPWPYLSDPQLKPIRVTPTKADFRWVANNEIYGIDGNWDLYFAPQNAAAPNFGSTPTVTNFSRDTFGNFKLNQTIGANQAYNLFIRHQCADTWGCWSEPMTFFTPPVVATATNVQLDSAVSYPGGFNASAIMHWETIPDSFAGHWQASWDVTPYPENINNYMTVASGTPVDYQINGLQTSTTYDLWLRAVYAGQPPYDYWQQDGQGPFPFTTYEPCIADYSDPIQCNQLVINNFNSAFNVFRPSSPCGGTNQANAAENLRTFKSTKTGAVAIRSRGADGQPGVKIAVYYKKRSGGCGISGWTHIGCWEMGQVQPLLYFNAEKDSTYYLLFDTYTDTDFAYNYEIEQCNIACEKPQHFIVTNSDANSITLRWNSLGPGVLYDVDYAFSTQGLDPNWNNPRVKDWPDTFLVLNGMAQDTFYDVFLHAKCGNNSYSGSVILEDVPTGSDHPYQFQPLVWDCNPAAPRPFGITGLEYRYETMPITVTNAGTYNIRPFYLNWPGNMLALYENNYNENAPYENLIAYSDTNLLAIGKTDISASLQPGKQYYLQVFVKEPIGSPDEAQTGLKYIIRGAGFAQVEAPMFDRRLARPHGKIWEADGTTFFQNYTCADTSGWIHFYARQPTQRKDHYLLFSVKSYAALLPYVESLPYGYSEGAGGAIRIQSPPAMYSTNPSGWYVMNRYWDLPITLDQQPEGPVEMRFYYTDQDFNALRDSVIAVGGTPPDVQEQLYFYKVNDFYNRYNPDPGQGHADIPAAIASDADGYWEYANGPAATDSTWRHDVFNNGHVAEMIVRHFSGGGGGIGANLKGATSVSVHAGVSPLSLKIYPNPSSDRLYIEGLEGNDLVRVCISNLLGKIVLQEKIKPGEPVQVHKLPTGAYLLTVKTEHGTGIWKIIKH